VASRDLKGPQGTRDFKNNKIDRNELQIRTNSQTGTGTKIAEKLNNFSPVLNPETS
jgi:hypothetical protein